MYHHQSAYRKLEQRIANNKHFKLQATIQDRKHVYLASHWNIELKNSLQLGYFSFGYFQLKRKVSSPGDERLTFDFIDIICDKKKLLLHKSFDFPNLNNNCILQIHICHF